jgi:RyR domain
MKIRDLEWWIVGILGIASFVLAIIGFNELFSAAGTERNFLDLMFQSMKIFGMEFVDDFQSPLPWQLEISRWLAPGVLLYTAAKAILYFIKREFKSLTIKFYKNHVIVTSLNEKSRFLVNDLLKNGRKVIVIAGIENSRKLDVLEKAGAVIIEGDFANVNFLKTISAHKAKYFVFVDDDETNISNAIFTYQYLKEYGSPDMHSLFTHVSDDVKLKEFVELKFFEELMKKKPADTNCEIRIFSINERTSRTIFQKYPPDEGKIISCREDDQIHTAVIGSGDLALSMILRLARTGHFANLKKIKISWFHEGEEIFEKLKHSYPQIDKIIELHSYEGPLHLFDSNKFEELNNSLEFCSVYVVCKDDSLSTRILTLISNIDVKNPLKIILTLMNPDGILNRWYKATELGNIDLYKFNLIEESFTEDSIISEKNDELAKLVHEFYLPPEDKIDRKKSSHVEWGKLSFDFKIQNRAQADHIFVKTRAMNIDVDSSPKEEQVITIDDKSELFELLAETEHNRWMAQLYLNGWKYAEVRDDSKKLHTDLKPYSDLSEGVKDWDRDAVRNIPKLIKLYEGENA